MPPPSCLWEVGHHTTPHPLVPPGFHGFIPSCPLGPAPPPSQPIAPCPYHTAVLHATPHPHTHSPPPCLVPYTPYLHSLYCPCYTLEELRSLPIRTPIVTFVHTHCPSLCLPCHMPLFTPFPCAIPHSFCLWTTYPSPTTLVDADMKLNDDIKKGGTEGRETGLILT